MSYDTHDEYLPVDRRTSAERSQYDSETLEYAYGIAARSPHEEAIRQVIERRLDRFQRRRESFSAEELTDYPHDDPEIWYTYGDPWTYCAAPCEMCDAHRQETERLVAEFP